jgi:ABC-type transporter Mla maintaining outer membrane lipid asymmetry ATPase subunit MlaF
MALNFDKTIQFNDLTQDRFLEHDIGLIIDEPLNGKNPTATLFCEESIVFVRTNAIGVVTFIPVYHNNERLPEIIETIKYVFATDLVSED